MPHDGRGKHTPRLRIITNKNRCKTNFKLNTMSESTKPTSNEPENGNKSKPLLGDDFVLKTKFNQNDIVFHALFGWCKIRMISEKSAVIDCEAKTITYYIIAKGLKHYERDENGCQIVCVPVKNCF